MFALGVTADLVDVNDIIDRMSGGYNAFKSAHGAIGEHVPKPVASEAHHLDINGLSLNPRDEAVSRVSRDTDRFSRGGAGGGYDPLSIWSKADSDHGWDRASANHFASRPQSPQRSTLLVPDAASGAAPKTAPLPPYAAFNPVITPPAPAEVPLPHKSPSPPRSSKGKDREVVVQAGHHLQQLQALVGPLVDQLEELEKLKAEITMWKNSCEAASMEVTRLQAAAEERKQPVPVVDGDYFNAVLLDGETLVFHDKHLKAGPQGGQAAARALLKVVAELDTSEVANSPYSVTVQIFISKANLGNSLIKSGLVASWSIYEGFWHGLSSENGLISVIDVGPAKNAADVKLKEHLKLYSGHSQCSKVLLGTRNPSLFESPPSDKVVLIKSSESSGATTAVTFPNLFRSEPLPVVPISFSSVVSSAPQTPRKPNPPVTEQDATSQSEDLEVEVYDWEELPKDNIDEWTEARKKGHKRVAAGSKPTPGSAKKASASASPAMSGKKDKKFKRGGVKHRKDYGVRDMKPRPCHSHYLSPAGCRNDVCHYGHEYDLDDDQLNELAHLAKQIPCPFARGNRCHFDDETCIYGHKCPRGSSCTFDECRFDEIDPDHQDWN